MTKSIDSNQYRARLILEEICGYHSHRVGYQEAKAAILELCGKIVDGDSDFYFEFDGNEYRIIKEACIWEIYRDEIKYTVEDCYALQLDKVPAFIALSIDWEQTAQNTYVDGYGHTFSGYDGSELEASGYYIFRTN